MFSASSVSLTPAYVLCQMYVNPLCILSSAFMSHQTRLTAFDTSLQSWQFGFISQLQLYASLLARWPSGGEVVMHQLLGCLGATCGAALWQGKTGKAYSTHAKLAVRELLDIEKITGARSSVIYKLIHNCYCHYLI